MGAPGAGKGTQAAGIAKHYEIPAISTGDIFRKNVAEQTELGQQVDQILKAGEYVPDELTESIVFDRLGQQDAKDGFLLDGFPRTLHQVEALDAYLEEHDLELDAVISLDVPQEVLIERIMKRAGEQGRADDNAETVKTRMQVYETSTAPLLRHYAEQGLVVHVSGVGSVEEVNARIFEKLDQKN